MTAQPGEYERIRAVLENAEEPMTAREILDTLEDAEIESVHRVATVLGRRARSGSVDVIRDRPYRYRLDQ
jgi:predicted Zn-ribbon and HTH transcriptional regulator